MNIQFLYSNNEQVGTGTSSKSKHGEGESRQQQTEQYLDEKNKLVNN
jgi:hypothetical protein